MDSFLEIKEPLNFIFYLFSLIITIHWWLSFKAADDIFKEEVNNSATDLIMGIIYIIIIEYIILFSKTFDYKIATIFLVFLLSFDLLWSLLYRFVGKWDSKDKTRIKYMEKELNCGILVNSIFITFFGLLALFYGWLVPLWFVILFIGGYLVYIFFTFRYNILDIDIF